MIIEHFFGSVIVNNESELQAFIETASMEKPNEFWLSDNNSYPCLCISTNGNLAHVHFFQEEGAAGFQAVGHMDLNEDIITFYTNNSSEKIEIEKEYAVTLETAAKIADEFFISQEKPECVEWNAL